MLAGLAAFGSVTGGILELPDGEAPAPPGDPVALAEVIQRIGGDPEKLSELSRRNTEVAQRYRSDRLKRKRLQFWRCVADLQTGQSEVAR